jgi:glycerate kinase
MKILIAPDKFKGTLKAREVADAMAAGLLDSLPEAKIDIVPLADGGEGTAEVISQALGGKWMTCKAHDPLGREISAGYGWIADRKLAVMEMSEAAGMRRLTRDELNPEKTNTFGVGEMILDAARHGAHEIILGLGGSATNDGGSGMAEALGFIFFDGTRATLDCFKRPSLQLLQWIEEPPDFKLPKIIAAIDVKNPLLGENGATRVFGPQKGATPTQLEKLEQALRRLADVVTRQFGFDYRNEPGAGAAGGLGFGLLSFCAAKIRPGFDVVAESVGLEERIKDADLVITGEGSLDAQTLEGKTPAGVARVARKLGKRVFAFVGRASADEKVRELFDGVYTNARTRMTDEENAAQMLRENAREFARKL